MASDARFDPEEPPRKRSTGTTCLIGCLVMFVIGALIVAAIAFWVSQNWREWASVGADAINDSIDASDLPAEEKAEIKIEVERLAEAVRGGRISIDELALMFEKLTEWPLMPSINASMAETKYFDRSGLSDEEKAEGRVALHRFLRGMIDEKINQQATDRVLAHIATRQADDTWRLRDQVSDDELRAFLAEAKREADQAAIPEEPESFDPSDEFKRIIDESLGEE